MRVSSFLLDAEPAITLVQVVARIASKEPLVPRELARARRILWISVRSAPAKGK